VTLIGPAVTGAALAAVGTAICGVATATVGTAGTAAPAAVPPAGPWVAVVALPQAASRAGTAATPASSPISTIGLRRVMGRVVSSCSCVITSLVSISILPFCDLLDREALWGCWSGHRSPYAETELKPAGPPPRCTLCTVHLQLPSAAGRSEEGCQRRQVVVRERAGIEGRHAARPLARLGAQLVRAEAGDRLAYRPATSIQPVARCTPPGDHQHPSARHGTG